jgi:hypothetical protein
VPKIPDFLCSFVDSASFMRLSLMKGAHVDVSRAVYRKFGCISLVLCEMWETRTSTYPSRKPTVLVEMRTSFVIPRACDFRLSRRSGPKGAPYLAGSSRDVGDADLNLPLSQANCFHGMRPSICHPVEAEGPAGQ